MAAKHKRTRVLRGEDYSIAESALEEYVGWFDMPWEICSSFENLRNLADLSPSGWMYRVHMVEHWHSRGELQSVLLTRLSSLSIVRWDGLARLWCRLQMRL